MAINLSKGTDKAKEEVKYTVLEECGTVATKQYKKGDDIITEELKLRYLKWSKGEARYDLRSWIQNPDGTETVGKGIGMTGEALINLGNLIAEMQREPEPKKKAEPKAKATSKKKSTAA